jgi:hypothetical protein
MIAGEFIALVALLIGGGLSSKLIWSWIRRSDERSKVDAKLRFQMMESLTKALHSKDYRQLDDFMVLWLKDADPELLKYVKVRRDEMFVDSNT